MDSLNPAQRQAVNAIEGPVLILAGAGTGKTRTVTCRIAHMIENGIQGRNLLAVTFTNKAANEMRERIAQMVDKKSARAMIISTFHSLCTRILREDIGRLGYKENFTIYLFGNCCNIIFCTGNSSRLEHPDGTAEKSRRCCF